MDYIGKETLDDFDIFDIESISYESGMNLVKAIEQMVLNDIKIIREDWKDHPFTQYIKAYKTKDGCIEYKCFNSGIGLSECSGLDYSFHSEDYEHNWYIFDDQEKENIEEEHDNTGIGSRSYQMAMNLLAKGYLVARKSWCGNNCLNLSHDILRNQFFFETTDIKRNIKYSYILTDEDIHANDWFKVPKEDVDKFLKVKD